MRGREVRRGGVGRGVLWGLAAAVPLAFLGVFFAWPVVTLVARGFVGDDGGLDLSGFAEVFSEPRTWRIVGLTLWQAVLGTALSLLLGVPGAYVLYRCRFPGRRVVRALVTVPFVLPTVVVGVAFRSLLVQGGTLGFLRLDETFAAIVVALVLVVTSVVTEIVRARRRRAARRSAAGAGEGAGQPPIAAPVATAPVAATPVAEIVGAGR